MQTIDSSVLACLQTLRPRIEKHSAGEFGAVASAPQSELPRKPQSARPRGKPAAPSAGPRSEPPASRAGKPPRVTAAGAAAAAQRKARAGGQDMRFLEPPVGV